VSGVLKELGQDVVTGEDENHDPSDKQYFGLNLSLPFQMEKRSGRLSILMDLIRRKQETGERHRFDVSSDFGSAKLD